MTRARCCTSDEALLYNPRLQRKYRIDDDIPVMLVDEAETADDAEHERLLAKADAGRDALDPASRRRCHAT